MFFGLNRKTFPLDSDMCASLIHNVRTHIKCGYIFIKCEHLWTLIPTICMYVHIRWCVQTIYSVQQYLPYLEFFFHANNCEDVYPIILYMDILKLTMCLLFLSTRQSYIPATLVCQISRIPWPSFFYRRRELCR